MSKVFDSELTIDNLLYEIRLGRYLDRELVQKIQRVPDCYINKQDFNKKTLLMYACYWDHKESIKLLLQRGADPLLVDINNNTALDWADLGIGQEREIAEIFDEYNNN